MIASFHGDEAPLAALILAPIETSQTERPTQKPGLLTLGNGILPERNAASAGARPTGNALRRNDDAQAGSCRFLQYNSVVPSSSSASSLSAAADAPGCAMITSNSTAARRDLSLK